MILSQGPSSVSVRLIATPTHMSFVPGVPAHLLPPMLAPSYLAPGGEFIPEPPDIFLSDYHIKYSGSCENDFTADGYSYQSNKWLPL